MITEQKTKKYKKAGGVDLYVFTFTHKAYELGERICALYGASQLIGLSDLRQKGLGQRVKDIFAYNRRLSQKDSSAILFVSAAGIAVRAVAPYLQDKTRDPAVLLMDERANFVVSLLSGHLGGANMLAKDLASKLGVTPVITTATDVCGLACLEDLAIAFDLAIEERKTIKKINSAILKGERITVIETNPARLKALKAHPTLAKVFTFRARLSARPDGQVVIISSAERIERYKGWKDITYLRPREFVVGIGCKRGVTIKEVTYAFDKVLKDNDISRLSIRNLASIDVKSNERGLLGLAGRLGVEIDFFKSEELKQIKAPSGVSPYVLRTVGVGGVAEPSAMLSAETRKIWIKKVKFPRVTIAVAKANYSL